MTVTIELPLLHDAQWEIISHPARFRVASCGRRFGKTLAAGGEAIRYAAEGKRVWWVAPSYEVTRIAWRGVTRLTRQMPGVTEKRAERMILFPGGGFIAFKTANTQAGLRGEGLDFLIIDEAAFVPEVAWQDDLRPALSDRQGKALFISTPNGRNWFWRAWQRGQDPANADWKSWVFPTGANPYIEKHEIEEARQLLPVRTFEQEYLAAFLDDGGAVFRNLAACVTSVYLNAPVPGRRYVFGVDWAKEEDFTVIVIMDQDARQLVHLDRFNEIGWRLQRGRLRALYDTWKPSAIWAEENSIGGPNIEELQAEGLPIVAFTTTAASKGPLIESLALAFEQGDIGLYADPILMGELQAYTMERLPSGRYRYSAPVGMHDDTVIALALAWHGATLPRIGFVG